MQRYRLVTAACLLLPCIAACSTPGTVRVCPACYGDGYYAYFLNRRGAFFRKRYEAAGAIIMEPILLAFPHDIDFIARGMIRTGLGHATSSDLPFAVQEVDYALMPFLEHARGGLLYRAGLDHSCFHLAHTDDPQPWFAPGGQRLIDGVYYNRLFAGAGSRAIRPHVWRQQYRREAAEAPPPPSFVWYAEGGHYLTDFFGLFSPEALYAGHDWEWDLEALARLALWKRRTIVLFATGGAHVWIDKEGQSYWRAELGADVMFVRTGFGTMFYLKGYVLDEHPRDSREDLVETGMRFFFW